MNEPAFGSSILPGIERSHYRRGTDATIVNRLPFLSYLPHHFRSHCVAMIGEFVGTFLFLFFAFSGTQVANTQVKPPKDSDISRAANPAQLLYISLCFGFSLAVNAWVFFRISGGLFNPAVTLSLCLVREAPYVRGLLVFVSQLLGGIAAAGVVAALFPGPLNVKTTLRPGTSVAQGLFIEMFLTAQLVFTIFMLAAEKHKATFIAPVGIGLSLFIAELSGTHGCDRSRMNYADRFRCFLHWRLPKPCTYTRPLRHPTFFRTLSLDILGWSHPGITLGIISLHGYEETRV